MTEEEDEDDGEEERHHGGVPPMLRGDHVVKGGRPVGTSFILGIIFSSEFFLV